MFKNIWRDYFAFNRNERKAVNILLVILFLVIIMLFSLPFIFPPEKTDFSGYEKKLAELFKDTLPDSTQKLFAEEIQHNYAENDYKLPKQSKSNERFSFNPNNLSVADWKRLGLTEKQIKTIKNYEAKGGKFRKKEDVKKLYCITAEMYASLEPYIIIPIDSTTIKKETPVKKPVKQFESKLVELNSADSTSLIALNGIGSFLSKSIIKYRNLLGGYASIEQLKEVYGIREETYNALKEKFTIDISLVKKININTATIEELKRHPYIKYNLAIIIVNYRKMHGNYKSINDIKDFETMTPDIFTKLANYITI